jgi:molybdopterin molybdotransferase
MADLLNVEAALAHILQKFTSLPSEQIALTHALGRVLAEDIVSDINLPPFANSSMDGYAVRAEDVSGASSESPVRLRVVMDIPAGSFPTETIGEGQAARIMTGAPLPDGADAVVPVEQTDSNWRAGGDIALAEQVGILQAARPGDSVRPAGEDVHIGQTVLQAGTILRPQDIGILAALGHAQVAVVRQPRVAIVSTGDELVDVDEPLGPGKIRDSNSHTFPCVRPSPETLWKPCVPCSAPRWSTSLTSSLVQPGYLLAHLMWCGRCWMSLEKSSSGG